MAEVAFTAAGCISTGAPMWLVSTSYFRASVHLFFATSPSFAQKKLGSFDSVLLHFFSFPSVSRIEADTRTLNSLDSSHSLTPSSPNGTVILFV